MYHSDLLRADWDTIAGYDTAKLPDGDKQYEEIGIIDMTIATEATSNRKK